jgi:hypothetical protein
MPSCLDFCAIGVALLSICVIRSDRVDMLCDICHKREATVHVTSNVPIEDLVDHPKLEALVGERDVCDVCLPLASMSMEELKATVLRVFHVPPADLPGEPGENRDSG